jgi:glycosyltransferase involved in cell wall biosynthesis
LERAGVDVTVFASGDSEPEGGRLVPTVSEALRLHSVPIADPIPYHLSVLAQIAKRAKQGEFDLIHNHHDYWLMPLSSMVSTPVLTTLHGRLDLPDTLHAFDAFPENYFVSISDAQRKPLPHLNWVRTIHHGLDLDSLKFCPKPGGYLAFLGRITPDKRPEWAIEIAQRAGVPLKIAAKIEGKDSQHYFDQFILPHVDGRNVEYLGEISEAEKSDFLGHALGLVFPIDWPEPFGLVVAESLACGTPVLARPCGSIPELLESGRTGFCAWDIRELAARVADLETIDRLGCRQWVESRFSLERMTEDYIDVYQQLTAVIKLKQLGAGESFGKSSIEFGGSASFARSGHPRGSDRARQADHAHYDRRDFVHPLVRPVDGNT